MIQSSHQGRFDPPGSDPLEELSAEMVAFLEKRKPALASLVFSSPLSARTPDLSMVWHSGYRRLHRQKLVLQLLSNAVVALGKGAARLAGARPWGYCRYGQTVDRILVLASLCGQENGSRFQTEYVRTGPSDSLFVFGEYTSLGQARYRFSRPDLGAQVITALSLLWGGCEASLFLRGPVGDRLILLLLWTEWVWSWRWLPMMQLEATLRTIVQKEGVKQIGCVHEMHAYARIVWRVASAESARSCTIQHASVSRGKRWYFSYEVERQAGLRLPEVCFVFGVQAKDLLRPALPGTRLVFGCSQRYARWRGQVPDVDAKVGTVLLVGGLAAFDNEAVLGALKILSEEKLPRRVFKLRLHPSAQLSRAQKRWIRKSVRTGTFEVSNSSLKEDLEVAALVIGMSTSVLEEALLLNRKVIQVIDDRYRTYIDIEGVPGVLRIHWTDMDNVPLTLPPSVETHRLFRERLGLDKILVDYSRLFSAEHQL